MPSRGHTHPAVSSRILLPGSPTPAPARWVRLSPQLHVALGQGQAAGQSSLTCASSKGLHPRHLQRPVGRARGHLFQTPFPGQSPLCHALTSAATPSQHPAEASRTPSTSIQGSVGNAARVPGALCRPGSPALSHGHPPIHCVQYAVTSLEWTPVNLQAHEFLEATISPPEDTDQKQNKIEPNENNLLGSGQATFPRPDARKLS